MRIIRVILVFFLFGPFLAPLLNAQESGDYFGNQYFKQSVEYLISGDYDNAIVYSSRVLARDPNSAIAYTVRARAYFEKGAYSNAVYDCGQAIRRDNNNVSAYSIRANAFAKMGDLAKAIADWQSVLKINPENINALKNIELATTVANQ